MKKVFRTYNYGLFKPLADNREVKTRTTRKIINSIETVGYITNPIIVNEKMEVIDGQNRLEALKELHMPVDYIIVEGAGIEHCRALNINQSNWTVLDWIKSYASSGNESYQRLLNLIEMFPDMKLQVIAYATEEVNGAINGRYTEGKFTCTEEGYNNAIDALNFLRQVVMYVRNVDGNAYAMECAVIWGFKDKEVDNDKLAKKIQKYWSMAKPIANFDSALEELENIYNYKSRERVYIKTNYLKAKDGKRLQKKREKDRESRQRRPQRNIGL